MELSSIRSRLIDEMEERTQSSRGPFCALPHSVASNLDRYLLSSQKGRTTSKSHTFRIESQDYAVEFTSGYVRRSFPVVSLAGFLRMGETTGLWTGLTKRLVAGHMIDAQKQNEQTDVFDVPMTSLVHRVGMDSQVKGEFRFRSAVVSSVEQQQG